MTEAAPQARQRRPLWRRILKWTLATTGLLLLLVVLLLAWVGGTRSGLNFAWSLIGPRLPAGMSVARVEGKLVGPLTVTGVKLDTDSMHVSVDRIHLEWQFSDLFSVTVHVGQLAVSGVRYAAGQSEPQAKAQEQGEPFTLPDAIELPLQVRIDAVKLDDVQATLSPGAEPLVLTKARLQDAVLTADNWHIAELSAHGPLFDITAQAQLTPGGRYATQLALDAQLRLPQLAPIKASIKASGDLDQLDLQAKVAAPYAVTLEAQLSNIALDALKDIGINATLALDDTHLQAIRDDLPPLPPITTQLQVSGTLDQLAVEQTVAAPYNARLQATLADVLAAPAVDAQLQLSGTQIAKIKPTLPPVTLDTTIKLSGGSENLALQLHASADSERFGVVNTDASIRYQPQVVTINKLSVTRPDSPMQLHASGSVALAQGNAMDVQLAWQNLQWPLSGAAAYQSKQGQFSVTGVLDGYSVTGQMDWRVAGQAAGQLSLSGSGDLQSFRLAQLQTSGGPGDIRATADVIWAPKLAAEAHIEGTHINPGAIIANVPGGFALAAEIRAKQNVAGAIVAHVDTLTADGRLRGQPLHLNGQLAYLGDRVNIPKLALEYGDASASIKGHAGLTPQAALDLSWSISAPQLAQLWPGLGGTLNTKGHVSGTMLTPSVEATLSANDIKYGDYRVAKADLDADVDWSGASNSKLTLDVAGVKAAGQEVESLAFNMTGTPAQHTAKIDLDSSTAQLSTELSGSFDRGDKAWNFTLNALQLAYGDLAPWILAAPASGRVAASGQRIQDACLASGDARLCISGKHGGGGTTASLQLSDLAFAYAQPFLPDNLSVDGTLSGTVEATMPAGGHPTAKVNLTTTAGKITAEQVNGKRVQVLAFDPAQVNASLKNTALKGSVDLPLGDNGGVQASFAVAPGGGALTARPLTGALQINVKKLDFLTRIVSEVTQVEGHVNGDMQISGTLAAPRVLGNIALNAKRLVLLSPGLALTDVQLMAQGSGEAVDLALTAHSGGGVLNVNGGIGFGGGGPSIDLSITGQNFQVANTPMARAQISPDLAVSLTPRAIKVTGTLKVPKARITPRNLPAAGVQTVADDAVIVSEKQSVAKTAARSITADISVELGDVRIDGFGLKTGVQGTLRVQQSPGEPTTGTGRLMLVDGLYRAYGQNLDIQTGQIYFSGGPIADPGFKLRAARYPAEDITVGVQVRGSIEKPQLTLFSKPAMSQAEILSWLLLGRSLDGTTAGQDNLIARAALALGGNRGNQMLDKVGGALGLDDIGLGSAAGHGSGEAAAMVGKYLTPKLYISYGMGLFSSVSTLSLRYTLNSHWKLEGDSSSEGTGADIIYTFDR